LYFVAMDGVLLQVVLAGLAEGAVLGLVALGFSLVSGTARVLHFAHGDITMGAVFVGVLVVVGNSPTAAGLTPLTSLLLVVSIIAAGAVLSGLVAMLVVLPNLPSVSDESRRRLAGVPGWVAGGLAAGLLLRAVLGLLFAQQSYAVPDPLRVDALTPDGLLRLPGGNTLALRAVVVLVIGVSLGLIAERSVVRSRFGRSLRAVADDPAGAALCGVSVRRVVLGAFLVAGLLAGAAGVLAAPGRAVSVDEGAVLGLEAAAAAVLGGVGSLRGAMAGGLAVGLLQAIAGYLLGAGFYDLAPLALLVLLLAVRPQGVAVRSFAWRANGWRASG
jgi:branched-subunit amino acid ABC-type transport system permease component